MKRKLSLFLPPLALMALTFFLSAQPDLNSGLGVWDTILRKGAHMLEFGALAALWYRALTGATSVKTATCLVGGALIALAYSVSDEFHQHFVSGRHASPIDVGIDTVGILIASLLIARYQAHSERPDPSLRSGNIR